MPLDNRFRHQQYTDAPPVAPYELLSAGAAPDAGTGEFKTRMEAAGDVFRSRGIAAIYLVHGTFVGGDALGLWTEIERLFPALGQSLGQWTKRRVDSVIGERGNYSAKYVELFESSINRDGVRRIPVKTFRWSSQNNHIGRADGAIRLLDELVRESRGSRILLWGHSHAGNVFALLTNLIAGDPETVREFFEAAKSFYRRPFIGKIDVPVWESMRTLFERDPRPLGGAEIDIVTFGTPIRYGWETGGYSSLLHVVHHKPRGGRAAYLTSYPPTVETIRDAANGDFVQHFGIAGTNAAPGFLDGRTFTADWRLNRILQADLLARDLPKRLSLGMRVPAEGKTLLVDYGPIGSNLIEHHAGHAVYTDSNQLLFHCERVAEYLSQSS